jgi:hypothetical protein
MEGYFSPDGQERIPAESFDVPKVESLRIAFFLHFWNPTAPLRTSYGELLCPQPEPMPERLARLIPFEPVD